MAAETSGARGMFRNPPGYSVASNIRSEVAPGADPDEPGPGFYQAGVVVPVCAVWFMARALCFALCGSCLVLRTLWLVLCASYFVTRALCFVLCGSCLVLHTSWLVLCASCFVARVDG
jgi:hypothetical protein